jgi:hypothetical protein
MKGAPVRRDHPVSASLFLIRFACGFRRHT